MYVYGCYFYDVNGKCYLDFISGYVVVLLGYGYLKVVEVI